MNIEHGGAVARTVVTATIDKTGSVLSRPDIRAALLVGPVLLVLGLFEVGSGGLGAIIVGPLRTIVYVIQGYLIARQVRRDPQGRAEQLTRLAMMSAVCGWFISFVWSGLCLLVMGAITGGLFLATLPLAFAAHMVSILFNLVLTPLAARTAYRYGGTRLVVILASVGAVAAVIAVAVIGASISLLVWFGASLMSTWWR